MGKGMKAVVLIASDLDGMADARERIMTKMGPFRAMFSGKTEPGRILQLVKHIDSIIEGYLKRGKVTHYFAEKYNVAPTTLKRFIAIAKESYPERFDNSPKEGDAPNLIPPLSNFRQ